MGLGEGIIDGTHVLFILVLPSFLPQLTWGTKMEQRSSLLARNVNFPHQQVKIMIRKWFFETKIIMKPWKMRTFRLGTKCHPPPMKCQDLMDPTTWQWDRTKCQLANCPLPNLQMRYKQILETIDKILEYLILWYNYFYIAILFNCTLLSDLAWNIVDCNIYGHLDSV